MSQADHVPRDDRYHTLQAIGKALLDEERLRIVGLLAQQPATVAALRAYTSIKESRLVHHLHLLEDRGFIT